MKKIPVKTTALTVNLSSYTKNIPSPEDRPLFDEAIKAGNAGALRAAYLMIWLACAESLKRRFREAKTRDHSAEKIVGKIEEKECKHHSVDKFVLDKSLEYGFISYSDHVILSHIYEMRCLYGHPYEKTPSQEQVIHAAAVVVKHVLSKPVKLRYGYGEQVLKSLLEESSFLNDQDLAVKGFTKDTLQRLDEKIYRWLLEKYWKKLEEIADDPLMAIYFRRGIWFCQTMLSEAGVSILSPEDWHDQVHKFPKILIRICSETDIYKDIGELAQNSLVDLILVKFNNRSEVLRSLEKLYEEDALSERQEERFLEHVSEMTSESMFCARLSTKVCYEQLIHSMNGHNWNTQNPAIKLIVSNGPEQVAALSEKKQVHIGREILQCAEGKAYCAIDFLEKLSEDAVSWPFDLVRGIALESFTNEKNQIRFKAHHLSLIISALEHLKPTQRDQLISEITAAVDAGTPKYQEEAHHFEKNIEILKIHTWAKPLVNSLKKKARSLQIEDEGASLLEA